MSGKYSQQVGDEPDRPPILDFAASPDSVHRHLIRLRAKFSSAVVTVAQHSIFAKAAGGEHSLARDPRALLSAEQRPDRSRDTHETPLGPDSSHAYARRTLFGRQAITRIYGCCSAVVFVPPQPRRRSISAVPPHTPYVFGTREAKSKHWTRTAHRSQICLAARSRRTRA